MKHLKLVVNNTNDKKDIFFNKIELKLILNLYARMVSNGEWKDYGLTISKKERVSSNKKLFNKRQKMGRVVLGHGAFLPEHIFVDEKYVFFISPHEVQKNFSVMVRKSTKKLLYFVTVVLL